MYVAQKNSQNQTKEADVNVGVVEKQDYKWEIYKDKFNRFEFSYPSSENGWVKAYEKYNSYQELVLILAYAKPNNYIGGMITIRVEEPDEKNQKLEEFLLESESIQKYSSSQQPCKIQLRSSMATFCRMEFDKTRPDGTIEHNIIMATEHNNFFYTIELETETEPKRIFDLEKNVFESIWKSFRFQR
jgi:hypothetical protein